MNTMWSVVQVNAKRAWSEPWYIITTVGFIVAAMAVAFVISSQPVQYGTLAFVPSASSVASQRLPGDAQPVSISVEDENSMLANLHAAFQVITTDEMPRISQLLRNEYDGIIVRGAHNEYELITIRDETWQARVRQTMHAGTNGAQPVTKKRDVGVTLIGYLVMFVMLSGAAFMTFFSHDKESGTLRRVAVTPGGLLRYVLGHTVFNALALFVPIMLCLAVSKHVFNVHIGFTYGQYAWLIALLCALATSFAFFMTALIEHGDNAVALTSAIAVVTSFLAGTFVEFQHGDVWLQRLTNMLPQKQFMQLATNVAGGDVNTNRIIPSLYVLAAIVTMFVAGWAVCAGRFRAGRY